MTQKAREVLADCRATLALLEEDTDSQSWRIHWAAAVALIRAVGHVLHKVDVAGHPGKRKIIERRFRTWKEDNEEHFVFREFIEKERNSLLKEYHTAVHPISEVGLAFEMTLQPVEGGPTKIIQDVAFIDKIFTGQ